ncbi:M23 family metallopeptidase [Actinomycetospora lemnae]|uniref:M23 family metallopeptidase n=1 Tax=Actinomycetospora lemnae TaxID=3019891 RepID=A0ABT5SYN5_9PSEU|nr:M23 family metallopeptidase [Actinomycetospora sp. DW7H6]MDD7967978.1 M23 family metallopeptidase [Actinomycetospora sp. DW7H6]
MSTTQTRTARGPGHTGHAARVGIAGGAAVLWFAATALGVLDLPAFVAVAVLGLLVALSVEPDARHPQRGVVASRRNLALAVLAGVAFVPVAIGADLLLGRVPLEDGPLVLGALAAVCVVLPRLAETRDLPAPAIVGHRELILGVTALVAGVRALRAGELVIAMVAFAVTLPVVMAVRRVRLGACSPRRLTERAHGLQAANLGIFLAVLAAAGLPGTLVVWRSYLPGAEPFVTVAFFAGLALAAALVAVPRPRVSVVTNVLALLGSVVLVAQLVGTVGAPRDPVTIGLPLPGRWDAISAGRSALVNNHWTLTVQRDAVDVVVLVDGRTHRGDGTRLEDFAVFGQPVLAVADGRITEVVDGLPDLPVGGYTRRDMAGNHVVLDIGGGRHVLYGHLRQGSVRVRPGEEVRRGQVIGQVGDSGSSGEPHLHLQVQNRPTFDVEDRSIRTFPILFADATVADVRRGDAVAPAGWSVPGR